MDERGTCSRCGENKPVTEFYGDRTKASGRRSICKVCDLEKSADYYARNAERIIARVTARARERRTA